MQSFLSILPLVIIIGLFSLGWWHYSPKQKGKRGEQRVNDILSHLPKEYHILCDIVLKTKKAQHKSTTSLLASMASLLSKPRTIEAIYTEMTTARNGRSL